MKNLTLILCIALVHSLESLAQSVTLTPTGEPLRIESRPSVPMGAADYGSLISEDDLARLKFYLNSMSSGSNGTQIGDLTVSELIISLGTTVGSKDAKVSLKTQGIDRLTVTPSGNIGIGTSTPSNSALVEMNSDFAGVLPPRLTEIQRNDINNPAEGLTLYNSTEKNLNYYDGSNWNSFALANSFKNMSVFNASIIQQQWVVPSNVKYVMIEMWSGGQGGGTLSGGAGGSYGRILLSPTAGSTLLMFVGEGGAVSLSNPVGSTGSNSSVNVNGNSYVVQGGGVSGIGCTGSNIYCVKGSDGSLAHVLYQSMPTSGNYSEFFSGGTGGDSGLLGKGGKGLEWLNQPSSAVIGPSSTSINVSKAAKPGSIPGGGGGGGDTNYFPGASGAGGMIVIYY